MKNQELLTELNTALTELENTILETETELKKNKSEEKIQLLLLSSFRRGAIKEMIKIITNNGNLEEQTDSKTSEASSKLLEQNNPEILLEVQQVLNIFNSKI